MNLSYLFFFGWWEGCSLKKFSEITHKIGKQTLELFPCPFFLHMVLLSSLAVQLSAEKIAASGCGHVVSSLLPALC